MWFQHFRGRGTPQALAEASAAILSVTSTPLPQAPPANPKTSLNVNRLNAIIGAKGTVGSDGVASFEVPPGEPITLGGEKISPYLNVFPSVAFQPLDHRTVVVPDFGQTASPSIRWLASCARRAGRWTACTTRRPTSIPSCTFRTISRSVTPMPSPPKCDAGSTLFTTRPTKPLPSGVDDLPTVHESGCLP